MKSLFLTLLTCLFLQIDAQDRNTPEISNKGWNVNQSSHKERKNILLISGASLYTISLVGLNQLWYVDYPRNKFHFINDNGEWLQMDKFGHLTTSYYAGVIGIEAYRWTGMNDKMAIWYGGLTGTFFLTIIEILDYSRFNMFIEDGGYSGSYVHMKTIEDFIIIALQSAPYFLMKPLPWEADSLLQFVQSFENIFIFIFLGYMFFRTSRFDNQIALKWFVYLIVALSIYGLVVFNFGTAVRYKFPFIVIVMVGMAYELYLKHGNFMMNFLKKINILVLLHFQECLKGQLQFKL